MVTAATARPSYITNAIAASLAAKLEAAYKLFRDSDEGWDCWNAGGKNLRSKKVIVEGRLMTQYYPWKPNPYKKGSFQHRAWEEGLGYAEWEEQMGYDL